jgi:hypothetical protein
MDPLSIFFYFIVFLTLAGIFAGLAIKFAPK